MFFERGSFYEGSQDFQGEEILRPCCGIQALRVVGTDIISYFLRDLKIHPAIQI